MEMEAASRESVLPWNYFCQRSRRWSACWAAYRLEDPNGISLAGIVEQQVRANKPGKARAYDGDLLAWLLHAEVAVDVSGVELESCGLLFTTAWRANRPMSSADPLQSQNSHRPSLPKWIAYSNWRRRRRRRD
jgi:hypothetical protein